MNLRAQRKALVDEARTIAEKAKSEGRDFTDREVERVGALKSEIDALTPKIEAAEQAAKAVAAISGNSSDDRPTTRSGRTVEGNPFAKAALDAFARRREAAAAVNQKAIGATGSVSVTVDRGISALPGRTTLLSSIVPAFPQDTGIASYLRQTGRELNATTVPRGGTKPKSTVTLDRVVAKMATIAHIIEDIPVQWLEDHNLLADFLAGDLTYGVALALDEFILNGGTDEDGDTVPGILTASGVREIDYTTSPVRTVRRAIGALGVDGYAATHVVLNPVTAEDIENETDNTGRYLFDASARPFPVPYITSPEVAEDEAVVGAFDSRFIGIGTRGPVDIAWNPARGFDTNEVDVRAEMRATLYMPHPAAFAVANLSSGA